MRSQFKYQMWKDIWDKSFGVSSLLLALFFGIALGNIVRGVNLGGVDGIQSEYEAHYFFLPLWNSSFSPVGTHPGVIDWFTIIIGLISVVTLEIHGANWVIIKTNSSINGKLKAIIFRLNIALALLTVISLSVGNIINPKSLVNFWDKPLLLIFPIIYITGLLGLFFIQKLKKELTGFIFSSFVIVGGITSSLASIFPVILPSTNAVNDSLTIYNSSAGKYGLTVAMGWGIVGLLLLIVYFIIQKKLLGGKIDKMDNGY